MKKPPGAQSKIRDHKSILLLLILAFGLRLTWVLLQPNTDASIDKLPDQREYLSLGQNLLRVGSLFFYDSRFDQNVFAYRTPGYPFFIALIGGSIRGIRLAQAFVDSFTVAAIYLLAAKLSGDRRASLLAAALTAINPFLIYFTGLVLSETLFAALLAWSMLLLIHRRILSSAIFFYFTALLRPSAILLAPLLAIPAVLNNFSPTAYSTIPLRRCAVAALTMLIVLFIGLLPWAFRNHEVLGQWIWTTTNSGVTLYDGFNPAATGASDQRFLAEMPALRSINEVERSQYLHQLARQWISSHPRDFFPLAIKKIARTWSPVPLSAEFGRPAYRWISAMYSVPFDLLILLGLFSSALSRRAKIILIMPAIYFTIIHALSVGSIRYRVPIEPELAIIAAFGASTFLRTKSDARTT